MIYSAPGKVMLCGEYAVLRGGEALLMAVDRRVTAKIESRDEWSACSDLEPDQGWQQATRPERDDHLLAGLIAESITADQPFHLDTSSVHLREGDIKLGLGSSAAISVAAATAARRWCHSDATGPTLKSLVEFHDRLQGRPGSGADVACSAMGGLIAYRRDPDPVADARAPGGPQPIFVWSGNSASTINFIAGFDEWTRQPGSAILVDELVALGNQIATEWGRAKDAEVIRMTDEFATMTQRMGDAADLPIHGGAHAPLRRLARSFGVVYKPCGAGGGDLGIAVGTDREALERFAQKVATAGGQRIALRPEPAGVRQEPAAFA